MYTLLIIVQLNFNSITCRFSEFFKQYLSLIFTTVTLYIKGFMPWNITGWELHISWIGSSSVDIEFL